MFKKMFFLVLILFVFSCEEDSMNEQVVSDFEGFPIVYVDEPTSSHRVLSSDTLISGVPSFDEFDQIPFGYNNLNTGCDLETYNFEDFDSNMQWHNIGDLFQNSQVLGMFGSSDYGEFPSNILAKGLTAIFKDNDNFLKMKRPLSLINPKTNAPYYQTRLNSYYSEYFFYENAHYDFYTSELSYDIINGEINSSNNLKEILACEILTYAEDLDDTAFITDIGFNIDTTLCNDGAVNCQYRFVQIFIKWGYHV